MQALSSTLGRYSVIKAGLSVRSLFSLNTRRLTRICRSLPFALLSFIDRSKTARNASGINSQRTAVLSRWSCISTIFLAIVSKSDHLCSYIIYSCLDLRFASHHPWG